MTKEEWIEQEARKARDRYWGRIGDWDRADESIRQDWRNVVAPFYPEPVADADTLEKLAEVAEEAWWAAPSGKEELAMVVAVLRAAKPEVVYDFDAFSSAKRYGPENNGDFWKEVCDIANSRIRYRFELPKPEPVRVPVDVDGLAKAIFDGLYGESRLYDAGIKAMHVAAARIALAYLNIEPCAKPDDVAFRDALKKSQEIVNNWTPEQRNHNSIGYVGLQGNERVELENLRAECKRLQNYNHGLEHENKNLRQDLDALKVPSENIRFAVNAYEVLEECGGDTNVGDLESYMEYLTKQIVFPLIGDMSSRPVKVRLPEVAELCEEWETNHNGYVAKKAITFTRDYCLAHAVIDVPPGVPTMEELVLIGRNAYQRALGFSEYKCYSDMSREAKEGDGAFVVAVRDAILSAMPQRREWTEQDVEELAGILQREAGWTETSWHETSLAFRESWRKQCRAALGWFDGKRGG